MNLTKSPFLSSALLKNALLTSLLISSASVSVPSAAAPGALDTTFSTDGLVTTPIGSDNDLANAVAVLTEGKILVAGRSKTPALDLDLVLLRYNADGTLDTTFDTDGIVTLFLSGDFTANAIVVTPDDSIYLAGHGSGAFVLAKFTSVGALLDTSFASPTGYVVVDPDGAGNATYSGMAVIPSGKFALAGSNDLGGSLHSIPLVQNKADGTVDTTFGGGDGIVTVNPGLTSSHGNAIAVQPDDRILVTGDADSTSTYDMALLRFNSDGSLDAMFDTDGIVTTDIAGIQDSGFAIALQTDG